MLTIHKTSHIVLHKNKPHITLLWLVTGSSWAGWRSKAALSIAWLTQNTTTGWWQRGNIQNKNSPNAQLLAQSSFFSSQDELTKNSSVAIIGIKDCISASLVMKMMMMTIIIINVVLSSQDFLNRKNSGHGYSIHQPQGNKKYGTEKSGFLLKKSDGWVKHYCLLPQVEKVTNPPKTTIDQLFIFITWAYSRFSRHDAVFSSCLLWVTWGEFVFLRKHSPHCFQCM